MEASPQREAPKDSELDVVGESERMNTHPSVDEKSGCTFAFEIDNIYVSLAAVARILAAVPGVSDVRKRRPFSKWEEIHIWFRFADHDCVVWEPFGDNSRYWIGPQTPTDIFDISPVEDAFKRYQPPILHRVLGNLLSVRLTQVGRLLGGRGQAEHQGSRSRP